MDKVTLNPIEVVNPTMQVQGGSTPTGLSASMESDPGTEYSILTVLLTITPHQEQPVEVNIFGADVSACHVLDPSGYQTQMVTHQKVMLKLTNSKEDSGVELKGFSSILNDHSYLCGGSSDQQPLSMPKKERTTEGLSPTEELSLISITAGPPQAQQNAHQPPSEMFDMFVSQKSADNIQEESCQPCGSHQVQAELSVNTLGHKKNCVREVARPKSSQCTRTSNTDLDAERGKMLTRRSKRIRGRCIGSNRGCNNNGDNKLESNNGSNKPGNNSGDNQLGNNSGDNQLGNSCQEVFKMWLDPEFSCWETFCCYICPTKVSSACEQRMHVLGHHPFSVKPTAEGKCQLMVASFAKRLGVDSDQVKCILCDFASDSFPEFSSHVLDHLFSDTKNFNSSLLPERTTLSLDLREPSISNGLKSTAMDIPEQYKDYVEGQSGSKQWACKACGFTALHLRNLKLHIQRSHLKGEILRQKQKPSNSVHKSIICSLCGAAFRSRFCLKQHLIVHHDQDSDEVHSCSKCSRSFKTRLQMKQHERQVHTILRCPYPGCSIILQKYNLKTHIETKHAVTPSCHVCKICQKTFMRQSYLQKHLKAIHLGEKKFACEWLGCSKTFASSWNLKVHRYQHTGEKPLQCYQCGYLARQKAALDYHCKSAHKTLNDDEVVCVVKSEAPT